MNYHPSRLLGLLAAAGLALTMTLMPDATATSAPGHSSTAQASGTHLYAHSSSTSAYPHCHGGARYEAHRGWREFEVELHGIRRLSGTTLTVRVDGDRAGHMHVHHGHAHLYRHHGLRKMAPGDVVRVRTGSHAVVSLGRLHRMHH